MAQLFSDGGVAKRAIFGSEASCLNPDVLQGLTLGLLTAHALLCIFAGCLYPIVAANFLAGTILVTNSAIFGAKVAEIVSSAAGNSGRATSAMSFNAV